MVSKNQSKQSTEKFLRLLASTQELFKDSATKEEVAGMVKTILDKMKEMREYLSDKVAENKDRMDSAVSSLKGELSNLEMRVMELMHNKDIKTTQTIENAIKQLQKEVNAVQKLIPTLPDYTERFAEIEGKIPEPLEELPIEQQRTYTRDLLEGIQEEEEKLSISAIAHLEERLDELFKKPSGVIGGVGFNYGTMELHIIDDETPTGTVNGSNQAFTLNNAPNPTTSLKVYVNGSRMRVTEDYTFSGTTITFTVAPPTGSIILVDYRI